jgi:small subunit ribosomal protein S4
MKVRGSLSHASRALGRKVDNKAADKDPLGRRGPIRRRARKKSDYGLHLMEVQVCRLMYGIFERQFRNYFKRAKAMKGNTAEELLMLLEQRLDNAIFRSGLAASRRQARQMVVHRHFLVNGRAVDRPSYSLRIGDVFEVKASKLQKPLYKELESELMDPQAGYWLARKGKEGFKYEVSRMPMPTEAEQNFDPASIVEFYSKYV